MIALFWKEIRGLQSFLLAVLALLAGGHIYTMATEFPDTRPFVFARIMEDVDPSATVAILAVLLGVGLLLREHHDRTLHFLDALPVSRTSIFLAKITAGLTVLLAAAAFELGIEGVFGWLSRTSTDDPVQVRVFLSLFGLLGVTGAYMLGVSLILSFLRRWFALVLGLLLWGFLWLSSNEVPWIDLFNPFKLVPYMKDGNVLIPWRMLWAQGGVAVIALLVGWFCFLHLGMRAEDVGRKFLGRRWKAVLGVFLAVATPLVWVGVLVTVGRKVDGARPSGIALLREDAFAEKKTAHYHFLFREPQRELASKLMEAADDVYLDLAETFEGVEFGGRIIVDLASPVSSHAAGVANWTRLRIPIWEERPVEELLEILAHETTHAFQHEAAGVRYLRESRWTRFFNEGLATHIGVGSYASEKDVIGWERQVAAVASRGKVAWSQLADGAELAKGRDPEVVYPLGLAFCRGLERIGGGPQVFSKVMTAFADLPKGVNWNGGELWRHVFTHAGVDLNHAIAAYDEEVEALSKKHAEFVAGVPTLSGTVSRDGESILIRTKHSGTAPGTIVCCIEDDALLGDDQWHSADDDGVVKIPRKDLPEGKLRYMLGWVLQDTPWPVFESWTEAAVE